MDPGSRRARVYIVNPACDAATFFEADILRDSGYAPAAFIASLALPTLAACAPEDFPSALCDERVEPIDWDHPAQSVWITCNSRQAHRMRAIAAEFRRRGKTVVVGGPFATLFPEAVRPSCDVLFRGEFEPVAGQVFSDLRAGKPREEYSGPPAGLDAAPVPRWDLYPNDRAMVGALQISRGCPNDCGFCEIIQLYGRRVRRKPVSRVLAELDVLYRHGYRSVFITDDNFAAEPGPAKEVLAALADWNRGRGDGPVQFRTQMTVSDARDPELLEMCGRAGMLQSCIGVETPHRPSLQEAGKRPSFGVDLTEALREYIAHGINPNASMIVGFDADGPDIFDLQERFLTEVPVPLPRVGPLVLNRGARMYEGMEREQRLRWEDAGSSGVYTTNVIPRQMTRAALIAGLESLSRRLLEPEAFTARLRGFLDRARGAAAGGDGSGAGELRPDPHSAVRDAHEMLRSRLVRDPALAGLAAVLDGARQRHPAWTGRLRQQAFMYLQMRALF